MAGSEGISIPAMTGEPAKPIPSPAEIADALSANAVIARTLAAAEHRNWGLGFGITGFI